MTQPVPDALVGSRPAVARAGPSLARLRRGGVLFGASQALGMGLGFAGTMLLTRVAATREVASYLLLVQSTLTAGLLLQLGLGQAMLRFAPVSRGEGGGAATALLRRRLLGLLLAIWLCGVPLLALAWPAVARRLDAPELAGAAALLVGMAALAALGQLMDSYLRAFRFYALSAPLTQVLPRLLVVLGFLALWAFWGGASWELLAAVYAGSLILTQLGYAAALRRTTAAEESEPRTAAAPPGMRTILATTTAMGLRSAAAVLFVSSDLWILSWARPHEEVAVYGVASRLIQVMAALPGLAGFLIPQELALLYADGRRSDMERLARQAATAMAMVSAAAFVGLLAFSRPLLGLAFGEVYARGAGVVLVLALGSFWDTASGSAGYALQMTGHHVRLLLLTAGAAVLNLVLSVLLAPRWGGLGVACATSATLVALNLAMVASARRLVGIRTFVYWHPSHWLKVLERLTGKETSQ